MGSLVNVNGSQFVGLRKKYMDIERQTRLLQIKLQNDDLIRDAPVWK
jgi:hypothetical protein